MHRAGDIARRGRIELICGPMFSGKSERLIDWLTRARTWSIPTIAFKHASDDRYHARQIVTHNDRRAAAVAIASAVQMREMVGRARLVVVDEAQFFGEDLVDVCRQLADDGHVLVVAGLDRDSWGEPFGPIPRIEAIATRVVRTQAICSRCGGVADHTQRIAPISSKRMIGGSEAYEPRCRKCFVPPPIELRR